MKMDLWYPSNHAGLAELADAPYSNPVPQGRVRFDSYAGTKSLCDSCSNPKFRESSHLS